MPVYQFVTETMTYLKAKYRNRLRYTIMRFKHGK